jgi:hypothetical protein
MGNGLVVKLQNTFRIFMPNELDINHQSYIESNGGYSIQPVIGPANMASSKSWIYPLCNSMVDLSIANCKRLPDGNVGLITSHWHP